MLAHYHLDVLDRRVTLRRLHVLLRRLPAGAMPTTETPAAWSVESHLLAAVVDSVAALIYVTLKAAGVKNPGKPVPVPRPGPVRRSNSPAPMRATSEARTSSWVEMIRSTASQTGVQVQVIR